LLQELPGAGEMRHILSSKQFMSISVEDLQSKYPLVGGFSSYSIDGKESKL
jgi:hypothetical protein